MWYQWRLGKPRLDTEDSFILHSAASMESNMEEEEVAYESEAEDHGDKETELEGDVP